ncbi:MAG: hypothetical protein KF708_05405 [Pirellulales bacterium]|nr:hypothetical protein [Pirellulales bacterium]
MSRLWTLTASVVLLAGCHSNAPMQNPFFGPTTVPPPGTGTTAAPPAAPYYQGAPPPVLPSVPPGGQMPSGTFGAPPTTMPPLGTSSAPPASTQRMKVVSATPQQQMVGGTSLTRGRWSTPAVAPRAPLTEQAAAAEPAGAVAPATQAVVSVPQWSVVRLNEKQPATVPGDVVAVSAKSEVVADEHVMPSAEQEPARFQPAGDIVEIGQLPPARPNAVQSASYAKPAGREASNSVYAVARRPALRDEVADGYAAVYGYDPQYRWVKGQLEYSEVGRRWKLRYIPIDGATDDHGGSVLLPDDTDMGDLRPGDYVTAYGQLGEYDESSKGFAPLYYADRIELLEQ